MRDVDYDVARFDGAVMLLPYTLRDDARRHELISRRIFLLTLLLYHDRLTLVYRNRVKSEVLS